MKHLSDDNADIKAMILLQNRHLIVEWSKQAAEGTFNAEDVMRSPLGQRFNYIEAEKTVFNNADQIGFDIMKMHDHVYIHEFMMQHEKQLTPEIKESLYSLSRSGMSSSEMFSMSFVDQYSNSRQAALNVLHNLEVRNDVISHMEMVLSTKEAKQEMADVIRSNLDAIKYGSDDAYVLAVSKAMHIDMSSDEDVRRAVLLSTREDLSRIMSEMSSDHVDALTTTSLLTIHQTKGLDSLTTIVRNMDPSSIDYGRLMDRNYLEYLSSQPVVQNDQRLSMAFDNAIRSNQYLDVVVVQRNVEELTHRCDLSEIERQNMLDVAKMITYSAALSEGSDQFSLRKTHYEHLVDVAADKTAPASQHLTESLNETKEVLHSNALGLIRNYSDVGFSHQQFGGYVTIESQPGLQKTTEHSLGQAIVDPERLYSIRNNLEASIHSNRFFEEYVSANNNTEKHIRLESIRAEIQKYEDEIVQNRAIYEQYSSKTFGSVRFHKGLKGLDQQVEMLERRIEALKESEHQLITSIGNGLGSVDAAVRDSNNEFHIHNNAETARIFAIDAVREYGRDTFIRTAETRNIQIDSYSNAQLLEAMSHVDPRISIKEDYYKAGIILSNDTLDECVLRTEHVRQQILDNISKEINPEGKTVVTADIIQLTIDQEQVRLSSGLSPEEQIRVSESIKHLEQLKEAFIELQSLKIDTKDIGETTTILARYSEELGMTHCKEEALAIERDSATAALTREQFDKGLQDMQELNRLLVAYQQLETIREVSSTLSETQRLDVAHGLILDTSNTIGAKQIDEVMMTMKQSTTIQDFAKAYHDVYMDKSIQDTISRIERDPEFAKTVVSTAPDALRAIESYNEALSHLTEDDKKKIIEAINSAYGNTDNEKNNSIIEGFVFNQIDNPKVINIINENQDEIHHISLVEQFNNLGDDKKSELVYNCFVGISPPDAEPPTSTDRYLAAMAIAERGYGDYSMQLMADRGPIRNPDETQSEITKTFSELKNGSDEEKEAFNFCRERITAAGQDNTIEAKALDEVENENENDKGKENA